MIFNCSCRIDNEKDAMYCKIYMLDIPNRDGHPIDKTLPLSFLVHIGQPPSQLNP